MRDITTQCCVVGGGPGGIMTGFLLARAGIHVTVLEKWPDFFRDFRGDTIHPSTLELLKQLNLLDAFLALPHNKTEKIAAKIGVETIPMADFSHLNVTCPYLAFIPQWDFLNFIAKEAQKLANFTLLLNTEGLDLVYANDVVVGVTAKNADGEFVIHAPLVIGADGRHSVIREKSKLPLQDIGAPMDVLWFQLSRQKTDAAESIGRIDFGRMMVMIDRGDYWQCGFIIRKEYVEHLKAQGIAALHADIAAIAPELSNRFSEIASWDKIKLLQVTVNRLQKWYRAGLLCIGDAAHAMSPIGGVGINLAIQDAVATANLLTKPILTHSITQADLAAVQKRREWPTQMTQRIQVLMQNRMIARVLSQHSTVHTKVPFVVKLFRWFPILRRIPAYLIGMGFRPERIE